MTPEAGQQIKDILAIILSHPEGLSRGEISDRLTFSINNKTLQRRLSTLVDNSQIVKKGERKLTRYFPLQSTSTPIKGQLKDKKSVIFCKRSQEKLIFLENPVHAREIVSYNRSFLEDYVPNKSHYVPLTIRNKLYEEGRRFDKQLAAGTYAKQICQRLLIDLSYNSSRLEGNTYSRLDTQKLVEEGISAEGKVQEETVMIMNHKEAILFLIENAQEIELNSLFIRNLHHLLSQDLLADPATCGNIRTIGVNIGRSTYTPISNPHMLTELLELILQKAKRISDPFEQSFFLLIHLSYLQAFVDVNKRTSRLSCNMPFIKQNLCPLSFTGVARDDYNAALLAIYEKNETAPMLDLFAWAYSRSCEEYGAVKQSLGEIDAFRIQFRQQRKAVMGQIIGRGLHGLPAEAWIEKYCHEQNIEDIDKFTAMTLADLSNMHAGAIIGLGITEAQLDSWLSSKPY